jgi:hypothetical protein
MANTFELIASSTVGSGGAASIDFTSIPSTYTDLCIKVSMRDSAAGANAGQLKFTFNGNTANFSSRWLRGSGSGVVSSPQSFSTAIDVSGNSALPSSGNTASTFANVEIYIPNYAGSTNKSTSSDAVGENNGTEAYAILDAGLWSNTAAITQVTLTTSLLFAQYSTAYLYGISKS